MKLRDHLKAIASAGSPALVEEAFQSAIETFPYGSRSHTRIKNAMYERGLALVAELDARKFVPVVGRRRKISLCGQIYSVGYGQNGAGKRYCWAYAEEWVHRVLSENNVPKETIKIIWEWAFDYPHRALEAALEVHP